jgi:hypothetical protein
MGMEGNRREIIASMVTGMFAVEVAVSKFPQLVETPVRLRVLTRTGIDLT